MNFPLKKILLIGDPVAHSLSPAMHNAAFKALNLPLVYEAQRLTNQELAGFFRQLRNSEVAGLNVTVPHKQAVLKYLDELSPDAKKIGAVNTILVRGEKLYGENTDGAGYLRSLKEETAIDLKGKSVTLLGAGGAARGIITALCQEQIAHLDIVNRTGFRGEKLAEEFQKYFPKTKFFSFTFDAKKLDFIFKKTDLLINTTSAGLSGTQESFPKLPLEYLSKTALVSDIVYKPEMTPLLKQSQKLKLKIHKGLGMLLYQGALAFEKWTGKQAPVALMRQTLFQALS